MHLGVGGEVDDHIGGRVLDAADAALHGGVVAGKILQQVAEVVVDPRVQALVDAEDIVSVGEEPEREIGADLPARTGDEDAHAARIPGLPQRGTATPGKSPFSASVTSVTIARPCSRSEPSSTRSRRLLIGLGVGLLVGLAAVGATARSAAATPSAVPPGTPNLALIALLPADVAGGRVLHQGYFTDADLVAGYDREFKAGASIGHSRALSLDSEIDVLEDDIEAHGLYASAKTVFGSPGGRALLTKSILDEFKKDVKGKGSTKVTFGKIRVAQRSATRRSCSPSRSRC